MTPIQIIIVILASLILIKTISDFRNNKITAAIFLIWTILWSVMIAVTLLPQVANFIDKLLGRGRALDAIIYFSIIFIFYILFKIAAKLEKIEKDITTITREISLKDKNNRK